METINDTEFSDLVIIGFKQEDGSFYFASSSNDAKQVLRLLEIARFSVLQTGDK